jgi:hypothetical protein
MEWFILVYDFIVIIWLLLFFNYKEGLNLKEKNHMEYLNELTWDA